MRKNFIKQKRRKQLKKFLEDIKKQKGEFYIQLNQRRLMPITNFENRLSVPSFLPVKERAFLFNLIEKMENKPNQAQNRPKMKKHMKKP